jgi:hypothetical protein
MFLTMLHRGCRAIRELDTLPLVRNLTVSQPQACRRPKPQLPQLNQTSPMEVKDREQ